MHEITGGSILLSQYRAPELAAKLQGNLAESLESFQSVALDAKDLDDLGTVQLQLIIAAIVRANELGVKVYWQNLSPTVSDKAELMGLDAHLNSVPQFLVLDK